MDEDGKEEEKIAVDKTDEETEGESEEEQQDIVLTVAELQHSYLYELKVGNKQEANKLYDQLMELWDKHS